MANYSSAISAAIEAYQTYLQDKQIEASIKALQARTVGPLKPELYKNGFGGFLPVLMKCKNGTFEEISPNLILQMQQQEKQEKPLKKVRRPRSASVPAIGERYCA